MMIGEAVRIVRSYVPDGGVTLARQVGTQAVSVAQDIEAFLAARLEEDAEQESLWERFLQEPENLVGELIGALAALAEADPALARRLGALVEEYRALVAPAATPLRDPLAVEAARDQGPLTDHRGKSGTGSVALEDAEAMEAAYVLRILQPGETPPDDQIRSQVVDHLDPTVLAIRDTPYASAFRQLAVALDELVDDSQVGRRVRSYLAAIFNEIAAEAEADWSSVDRCLWDIAAAAPGLVELLLDIVPSRPGDSRRLDQAQNRTELIGDHKAQSQ
jgi:hypothetical protein